MERSRSADFIVIYRSIKQMVLCGANAYKKKYYFNPKFCILPKQIQNELHIMCVLFAEEIGGIFTVEYNEKGKLKLRTEVLEVDARYDDLGGMHRIKQLQDRKRELFQALELFYQIFFLGLNVKAWKMTEIGSEGACER